jgi:hypothetical protein
MRCFGPAVDRVRRPHLLNRGHHGCGTVPECARLLRAPRSDFCSSQIARAGELQVARNTPAPDLLHAFSRAHGLLPSRTPRSMTTCRSPAWRTTWWSTLTVSIRCRMTTGTCATPSREWCPVVSPGGIRYVRISGHHVNRDCFEIVRAPGPPDVLISALEVQGPQRGELRAYGGHRTADAPFGVGDVRKRDLPGVRHHRARAPRNFSTDGSASSASNRERLPTRKSSRHSAMRRCALPRRADVEQPLPPGGERRRGRSGGWTNRVGVVNAS